MNPTRREELQLLAQDRDIVRLLILVLERLDIVETQGILIMTTLTELQTTLDAVGDQLTKASSEISAEIATLQAEIAAGGVTTPGIDASVARLQGIAQALDDLNPDATSASSGTAAG